MIPDSSFKVLSDMAYNVEESKAKSNGHLKIIEGSQIIDFHQKRSFMVLEVNDNIDNGMQAMACQSLDESNHIVIAYSGTNAFNKKDILTDIDSVVLGKNNKLLTCPSSITLREDGISLPCKNPSQITTSKLFAQKLR